MSFRSSHLARRGTRVRLFALLITTAVLLGPTAGARDRLLATPYAPLVSDILAALSAEEALCPLTRYQHDVCFEVRPAGASHLAALLEEVVANYATADLRKGEWRAANGVWAITLIFGQGAFGTLEVFLAESRPGMVSGTIVYSSPR